jgi:hypothetical protein
MNKIFFDTEFTGLHQATTLISIGLLAETGETFYAELTDFDKAQIDPWLQENVIGHLELQSKISTSVSGWEGWDSDNSGPHDNALSFELAAKDMKQFRCIGSKGMVANRLKKWFAQFGPVQMWSDCLAYDWVLFNSLLADYSQGYPQLPSNVHYIPMDICTLFQAKGIDPDISREKYGLGEVLLDMPKHNALWDAKVIKACYEKLVA